MIMLLLIQIDVTSNISVKDMCNHGVYCCNVDSLLKFVFY
jgi:hypothetical protein